MEYIVEGEEFTYGYCYCGAMYCGNKLDCPSYRDCPSECNQCNQACPFQCNEY